MEESGGGGAGALAGSPGNAAAGMEPVQQLQSAIPTMSWSAAQLLNPKGTPASPSPQPSQHPAPVPSQLANGAPPGSGNLVFEFPNSRPPLYADSSGLLFERWDGQIVDQPDRVEPIPLPVNVRQNSTPVVHAPHITPIYQNGFRSPNGLELQMGSSLQNGFASQNGSSLQNGFPQNGFASQIERLNNVQERSDVPQPKRRKTQTESDPAQPGSIFAMTSSGILGEHIRQNEASADIHKPAAKPAETVDLTEGDNGSSDVQVVSVDAIKNEEVCFGMIEGAMINCHRVPAPKPGMISIGGDGFWPQVKVVLRRRAGEKDNVIYVYDYTRKVFGTVDGKTAAGLAPLLDTGTLRIRTDARIPTRRKDPGEQIGQAVSRVYKFELMLYGPRVRASAVGRHLLRHRMNLVSPPRVEAGVKVVNPLAAEARPPTPAAARPSMQNLSLQPSVQRTTEEMRSEIMGVFDSLPRSEDLPELEANDLVQTPLLRHQKQALYFMVSREQDSIPGQADSEVRSTWRCKRDHTGAIVYHNVVTDQTQRQRPPTVLGGILADMMGLGKTLSVLSLLTYTKQEALDWESLPPVQPEEPKKKVSHSLKQFEVPKVDIGLTRLKLNSRATLLICPLSTVTNWEEQMKQHIKPGGLKYHIYHGAHREKDSAKLADHDLVITTYGSASTELSFVSKQKKGLYPLEEIGWFRIVLDEAHMIREQSTLMFKSVCRLQASRRWAVTGTPVQNKLEDLAALLAFLRLKPFDEKAKFVQYIIQPFKACDPDIVAKLRVLIDTITLRRLKDKIDLPKRTDQIVKLTFTEKERQIYDWFNNKNEERLRVLTNQDRIAGRAMIHILRSILQLRLICAHGKELLNDEDLAELKGMTPEEPIDIDGEEEKPLLQEGKAYSLYYLLQETNSDICNKCRGKLGSNEMVDMEADRQEDTLGYMGPVCFHLYCQNCIKTIHDCCNSDRKDFVRLSRSRAMIEHESHSVKNGPAVKNVNNREDEYQPHTKTRALLEDLQKCKEESEKNPDQPPYKSVVFSGWTSHLDLIEKALTEANIIYTRLDGRMTRTARTEAMEIFRTDPTVQVILVSIMAGGLGLNLTTANTVYVMEPQFNPAAEAQAIDRVHRLGQKRPVRTIRYIMADSFEEKMLDLQDKKTKLANLSMDGRDKDKILDRTDAARQRLMDIRNLFK
ncbi:putative SWI/SNF-related matrix-associated actin-dependent regulator of chromatin subfamily A member 3-like 1 [Echria macrotheca]|uniref:SWI/SNF-related matrix-associated actin-dependent regulator of chromatin subfamily A member 3-like 1 n=1 Tax=Echria macrotheca TaxID=438768 RepID=A0AAJ0BEQ2_9PEZI|nr:putative SWI/SNF-related matrix-associated actin-dependent regulator of chromatin subfamily A member 3-like 1 [Echria macrotheca]